MIKNKLRVVHIQQILTLAAAAALSVVVVAALASVNSWAQTSDNDGTANTLRVSPVRSDVRADPGETKTVKVTVTNPSNQTVSVRVIQNDFTAGDEDGTPAIILDENEYAESHSLKRFMVPVENVMLEANESRVIDVQLVVPADAEPGGYFGVVRFAPSSPDDGGQVNVSASVASLVLLTVNGDAPEKLDITEFSILQNERKKNFFTSAEGLMARARFENKGDVQAGPFGKISVTKGDDIVHEVDFNNKEQRDVVLPDSARRWDIPLEGLDGLGRYTVSATFTYGSTNQSIEIEQSFWLIPKMIIVASVAGLVVLIGAVAGAIFFRRRRNSTVQRSLGSQRR